MVNIIFKKEGISGFFSGLSATLMGLVPTWTIYFTCYSKFKGFYRERGFSEGALLHLSSAVSAGLISDCVTNPLWVVKTRLQTQILRTDIIPYKGIADCFKRIVREEGFLALYKGLVPQLMGLVHVGIQFPVYEKLKGGESKEDLSILNLMFAAATSKILASLVAYPHEVIRSKLQFQHKGDEKSYYGLVDVVKTTIKEEGVRGMYKGLLPNLLKVIPSTAITFVVYENVNLKLSNL
eukprot:TRINITY_DN2697_c0_g1_i1.p1 TRINITY_DN2697_c0_g1~~TRINITY_DN2697_c0_g1_i1.p1  ORF type:complete len:237 (-),score=26.59 TRINITY_DN2697_c0_g1_i1:96-806(-)